MIPQVTGTPRLLPRMRVSGRRMSSDCARRVISESQLPSTTRSPVTAIRDTCTVPSARRDSTARQPKSHRNPTHTVGDVYHRASRVSPVGDDRVAGRRSSVVGAGALVTAFAALEVATLRV